MAEKETKDPAKVSPDDVRAYLRTRASQKAGKKLIAETHGRTKVEFQEETGFNKTAIAIAEKLDGFSPEVRQDVLRSLDILREGMAGVWGQQPDMFDAPKEPTVEEQAQNLKAARTSARRAKATTSPAPAEKPAPKKDGSGGAEAPVEREMEEAATDWEIPDDEPDPDEATEAEPPFGADDDFLAAAE